jgi:uncharacterized membrane protein
MMVHLCNSNVHGRQNIKRRQNAYLVFSGVDGGLKRFILFETYAPKYGTFRLLKTAES